MRDQDKRNEARRDVLAYVRALQARNGKDAAFVVSEGMSPDFLLELSTFAVTCIELLASVLGTDPDTFIVTIQAQELARQSELAA